MTTKLTYMFPRKTSNVLISSLIFCLFRFVAFPKNRIKIELLAVHLTFSIGKLIIIISTVLSLDTQYMYEKTAKPNRLNYQKLWFNYIMGFFLNCWKRHFDIVQATNYKSLGVKFNCACIHTNVEMKQVATVPFYTPKFFEG